MQRLVLSALFCLLAALPASAMVGGAPAVSGSHAAVLIVGSHGTSCTGAAIARDLILTAAHCALPGSDYKLVEFDAQHRPSLRDVTRVERHPQFSLQSLLGHRATADVALLKLAAPMQAGVVPATLAAFAQSATAGERFTVTGYGVTVRGDGKSGGTLRTATLAATGHPGSLQIRLLDPAANNARAGLGACTGDSGAPVFAGDGGTASIVGVVSWSTGPKNSGGCGGLTGVTPLSFYRPWIVETAKTMGSALH